MKTTTTTIKPPWPIFPSPHHNTTKPTTLTLPRSLYRQIPQSRNPKPPLSHHPNTTTTTADSGLLFRQKILYLEHHLRVDSRKALALNPDFRAAPLSVVKSVADCLASMGLDRAAASRVLDMHPSLLTADPHADLYPILDFLLHDAGLPFPDVRRALIRCPRLLLCPVDVQLRRNLDFLVSLGFPGVTPHTALLLVSSVEHTLRPKLEFLRRRLGLSAVDVASMAVRSPGILTLSLERNLAPKVEYFLADMRRDAAELRRFPQYFSFSLERKIRPRHRDLAEFGLSMPLAQMLKVSDGEFRARLVEMRLRKLDERG